MRKVDMTGLKFGRLTVLHQAPNKGGRVHWHCRCDCGVEKPIQGGLLRSGHTKSCGCWNVETAVRKATTHGLSKHPLYLIWNSMLTRCYNPNHQQWEDYGGRGISVSANWLRFENFYADMAPGYEKGLTIERQDNNLGYGKENCIWLKRSEQSRNRRNNVWIETDRGRMIMADAVRASGLSECSIRNRARKGCPPDRILDKRFWRPDAKSRT